MKCEPDGICLCVFSTGQVTGLQRGPTTEKWEYDNQGRIISRVFADGKIWSYTYLDKVGNNKNLLQTGIHSTFFLTGSGVQTFPTQNISVLRQVSWYPPFFFFYNIMVSFI